MRRSVDGRRRPPVWLANYRVDLCDGAAGEAAVLSRAPHGVRALSDRDERRYALVEEAPVRRAAWPGDQRPIVVGAGPGGLFAALRLGEAGAPVVLLERGEPVERRHHDVRAFWRRGELDRDSNVVFGEGGAGAFSDGKIYTRRRDGDLGWIFRRLVDHGADPQVLEEGWAHLGTDRIREILPRLRQRLVDLGVDVRFRTRVDAFLVEAGRCVGVRLGDGSELRGAPVIVATGHSARDTWAAMLDAGAAAEQRPIHIGARIEHPQRLIDLARYGRARGDLPPASYRLTSRPPQGKARPAHTFCMCPGGTVVAASNLPERVVVNGMSYSGRRSSLANAAVVVQVTPADYPGSDPLAGARFQDAIEARAFCCGGKGFKAPAQRVEDLLAGRASTSVGRVSYTLGVRPADLRDVLPEPLIDGMIAALRHFDRRLHGFAGPDAVLIAPETRTTAPLRFLRSPERESTTLPGLMPIGEGAGYAGGIVSAALDGYRAAQVLVERFCPRLA
ncbi:MAG: FAD-binding protein [Oligoflexia bacterium]|nr:FAD-binding protein [Oligoflexia bacterium]